MTEWQVLKFRMNPVEFVDVPIFCLTDREKDNNI